MTHTRTALAVAMLAVASTGASAQAIVNGDFDARQADQATARYMTTDLGGGWTTVFGNVDLVGHGGDDGNSAELKALMGSTATSGLAVDLNGNTPAMITQVLNTIAGQQYSLSFSYAANPGTDSNATAGFAFQLSPVKGGTLGASLIGQGASWQTYATTFVATGATALSFISTAYGTPTFGAMVDNVSVSAVPEPSEYAMMMLGLGVIGAAARRRQRKSA
ncbi:DUF642 domain-containing protein [Sphaerotilus mobilis]|uniref:Putative secreted protein with PEP-CTERM sorting signal n=1 Tax=Sphaerotilus mobilis TaxID=47994 RepID=A0A4Q7LLS7_9BURK|nr:DUF642 domain-containing protein [Sphaerotilus mobilis]RZS54887.1 putative secreted protein with PEP-CTERM sorting signal [Sphaerotilus mobilis]